MRIKRGICGGEGRNERGLRKRCLRITGEIGGDYVRLRRGLISKRVGITGKKEGGLRETDGAGPE